MDTIRNYLENMFLGYPKNEKILKAKEELLSMMDDKYHQLKEDGVSDNEAVGIVISEFGNLDEVSEILGLNDQIISSKEEVKLMTNVEVNQYLYDVNQCHPKLTLGIGLIIFSVTAILTMVGLYELGALSLSEDQAALMGAIMMMVIIAIGVYLIVSNTMKLSQYDYLKFESVTLDYSAQRIANEYKEMVTPKYRKAVSSSVLMYIMSIVPLFVAILVFGDKNDGPIVLATALIIVIVAFATYHLVRHYGPHNAVNKLLNEGEYSYKISRPSQTSEERKAQLKKADKIDTIYWALVTAIYLGYSLITRDWGRSWMIWPIAGVLSVSIDAYFDID